MSEVSVEVKVGVELCRECGGSDKAIWVETPWNRHVDGSASCDYLCEKCWNKLNVKEGIVNIKGSQWQGEDDVETVFWHDEPGSEGNLAVNRDSQEGGD